MVNRGTLGNGEIGVGILSILGSLVIMFTYYLFPNLRKLRYVQLVFYVALNDLIASIGLALGPVPNDSFECWFQGLSSDINYISSAFWTTVILYQVYLVVIERGTVLKNMFYIHLFCWGWPVVLGLLPLSTNTINNPDDESTWCFVANRRDSPPWGQLFWIVFSFFLWMWLAMLANVFMIVMVLLKLRKMQVVSSVVLSTVRKLIYYPLITIFSWSLNTVANLYVFSTNKTFTDMSASWRAVYALGTILALLQGFLNCIVFVGMNTIVRDHWQEFFHRMFQFFCCCRIVKERAVFRSNSSSLDGNGTIAKDDRKVMAKEMEMQLRRERNDEAQQESEQESEQDQEGRNTTANLFRDTFLGASESGARLSAYFSVSLPVEDEQDFIGQIYTLDNNTNTTTTGTTTSGVRNTGSRNTRGRARSSDYSIRDSNFMRQSSIGGFIRGSMAMFTSAAPVDETKPTVPSATVVVVDSVPSGTSSMGTVDTIDEPVVVVVDAEVDIEQPTGEPLSESSERLSERFSERETVVSTVNPLFAE